jgi:hypothetical protein
MPHWLIKSAIHRVISCLPQRQFWNGLLQKYFTRSTELTPAMFEEKLRNCRRFVEAWQAASPGQTGFRALELGTGWYPVIPVAMYLCGAKEVWTIDIEALLSAERLGRMVERFRAYNDTKSLETILPGCRPERVAELCALAPLVGHTKPGELLSQLKVRVLVGDAAQTGLDPGSINLFFSNGVLEYIPRGVLQGILKEAQRLAAPGAVMCHRINLVDQFSTFDRSLTPFNFLQFSPSEWRRRDSPLISQNRLRISDYRELIRAAGFTILKEDNTLGNPDELARVRLAPEFRRYPREDLLVIHSYLTAQVPGQ